MLRIAGLLLLCGSFIAGGFFVGERFKQAHKDTLYLLLLIRHVSREMNYASRTLKECFAGFPDEKRQTVTKLLANREFESALSLLSIPRYLKGQLLSFFQALGKEDCDEEDRRCRRMIEILENEEERLRLSVQDQVKVARTVGVCIGGVLMLLLL